MKASIYWESACVPVGFFFFPGASSCHQITYVLLVDLKLITGSGFTL